MGFGYLAILSAGIGLIASLVVIFVNDFLLHHKLSVIEPEHLFAHAFSIKGIAAAREGIIALFIASWFVSFGYAIMWLTPFIQNFSYGSPWVAAYTYCFCAWIILMFVVFPLMHKGFFGLRHHEDTAYSSAILLIAYAFVLAASSYIL